MLQSGTSRPKKQFGAALVGTGGFPAITLGEFGGEPATKIRALLERKPPVFLEDNPTGLGECGVCNKCGVLGRCPTCGFLMHFSCISPTSSGDAQKCPRCLAEDDGRPEEP